ncbi:unnamed protein product [Prunus armeniaca]|uniref:RING-type domain-containing protein n=1 Tax=Prunus armeniaca TaxID=36596 RepID=A0A6J5TN53_PRUAR|nr:unnamed protein product [Prunus armeniaca]
MGLQNQLNDVSSDSIPLLLIALIASFINHLCSSLFRLLHFLGLSNPGPGPDYDDGLLAGSTVGSGLAGLAVLADQLALNRHLSYRYDRNRHDQQNDAVARSRDCDCVVCLSTLRDGDQVRMLNCRHVFHKSCFDGWLDHLNFNCPICRSPLVHRDLVAHTRRRLAADLLHWFSLR